MKTAIITGSSRGIGLAAAKEIIQTENIEVIGTSTSGNHTIDLSNFTCFPLDLGDENSIDNFINSLNGLSINYLINNAAILLEKWDNPVINFEQLLKTFDVNLFGTIRLTEKLLPQINNDGHIINITSGWGSFSEQNFDGNVPHYKMSKSALNMYTKLLAERLKPQQIKVSSFDPGWVKTDMGTNAAQKSAEEVGKELKELMTGDMETGQFWHKGKIRNW